MSGDNEYLFSKYQTLRLHSRSLVVDDLNRRIKTEQDHVNWEGVTLASIDGEAIKASRLEWPRYYTDEYMGIEESWEHLCFSFMEDPSHFNIAVWQELKEKKVLRGMALGRCSSGKKHRLNIHYIERSYAPDYFRGGVLLPILASAEQYAKLLGCKAVYIRGCHKLDEFEKYGYKAEGQEMSQKGGVTWLKKRKSRSRFRL